MVSINLKNILQTDLQTSVETIQHYVFDKEETVGSYFFNPEFFETVTSEIILKIKAAIQFP